MGVKGYMFAYMNTENKGHANRSMQYPAFDVIRIPDGISVGG